MIALLPGSAELARVEALRRLDVRAPQLRRTLDDLVALVADLVDAAAVSLVLVEHERAWTVASTVDELRHAEVPRAWTLADSVVRGDEDLVVVTSTSEYWTEYPALDGLSRPCTVAAQAVYAPGGQVVGALEVAWEGVLSLDGRTRAALARSATLASDLLELRAEASEYARFIELSPAPIAILDLAGAIEQVNTAFVNMLGVAGPSDIVGRDFLELVALPERVRVIAQFVRILFMQRPSGTIRLDLVGPDERPIPCQVSAGHIRGVHRHLQLVVHDLSEQIHVEDERSQLSEQLARAQRLDAVGQIAGGLAHDLNNLLAVMVANLELAEESLATAGSSGAASDLVAVGEDLAELRIAIDRASGLTTELQQFAREGEGKLETADVITAVDAVAALVGRSLGDDVELRVDLPEQLPPVSADPAQLERVLLNLVVNARDAVDGRGTIQIRAHLVESGQEALADRVAADATQRRVDGPPVQAGGAVCLQVADDGCGMDEATRARAFEPLFTTKADAGGSGLGLTTAPAFADQFDGQVTLDSVVGEGTTVSVLLPVGDVEAAGAPVGVDVPVMGARIVLVDPGERTRRVLRTMLAGAGYRVTAVASAEAAMEVLGRGGADVLVTDLALPGMSGTRLIDEVARRHPDVRCVALAIVAQPRTLRGVPVLAKPFSHKRLLDTVERVVADRSDLDREPRPTG